VKIDDKIPLTWNIYQPDKKKDANRVLVLLGHRWLMLDIKARLVYQVVPAIFKSREMTTRPTISRSQKGSSPAATGPITMWAPRKTFT
jgi:hypothetical protein